MTNSRRNRNIRVRRGIFTSSLTYFLWVGVNSVLLTNGHGQEIHPTYQELTETVQSVCQTPLPLVHIGNGYKLNVNANAKLSGFLSHVANIGVEAEGDVLSENERRAI